MKMRLGCRSVPRNAVVISIKQLSIKLDTRLVVGTRRVNASLLIDEIVRNVFLEYLFHVFKRAGYFQQGVLPALGRYPNLV